MKLTVLDNSNIVESYPGITLPLTYTFVQVAYRGVFRGAVESNLKDDEVLAKFDDVFDNMIASYQGRVYYSINNWYSLIDFIPFSKRIIPVWQDMMGVENKEVYLEQRHRFTLWQRAKLNANILKNALRVPRDMKLLEGYFEEVRSYFDETYSEELSPVELLALFHEIEHKVLDRWYVTLFNDLYAFIWTGLFKRQLKKKGIDVTGYLSGITSLESLKPARALMQLARRYGAQADVLGQAEVQD